MPPVNRPNGFSTSRLAATAGTQVDIEDCAFFYATLQFRTRNDTAVFRAATGTGAVILTLWDQGNSFTIGAVEELQLALPSHHTTLS